MRKNKEAASLSETIWYKNVEKQRIMFTLKTNHLKWEVAQKSQI